ncbi:MAG: PEP-CTERM sorting domain-containing protein [Fimbriimonadaceae bacterium]|nr:PEP-CTERM sorting domain-containing protein [Fimbriimonadaceae bacterium]
MKNLRVLSASTFVLAMSAVSSAAISFSNVSVTDNQGNSLVAGHSVNTGPYDIDFLFPNAFVGDPSIWTSASITVMFEADSGPNEEMWSVNFSVLGAVSGSGLIAATEQVDDLVNPGVIGSFSTNTNTTPLPISEFITFSRSSTRVKVTKTFRLDAPPTGDFDLAQISLVQQKFNTNPVPEPASMAILGVGALALVTRRRKKA